MRVLRRPGLRATVVLGFAGGSLLLSGFFATATYLVARDSLVAQRERAALQQSFADASLVREGLLTAGAPVLDVLASVSVPADSALLVERDGRWYSSALGVGQEAVPPDLRRAVEGGSAATAWGSSGGASTVVVGTPLPAVDARFYEVAVPRELQRTLTALSGVLVGVAAATSLAGAALGWTAARRIVRPLDAVAGAASEVAAGRLDTRLPPSEDPDLAPIVGSFNAMVDALHERMERDSRFSADVSHELRSPLTALTTSVHVLQRRRHELPERSRAALDLVSTELRRFERSLDDLLELSRLDAGRQLEEATSVRAADLVEHVLREGGRAPSLLVDETAAHPGRGWVRVDKRGLARVLVNLLENADRYGGGATAVRVRHRSAGGAVQLVVDDAGPGVPPADRERVFERFVRGGSRGSREGTGLGLSIVAQAVRAHDGDVWCEASPDGGARFVVELPSVPAPVRS